MTSGPGRFPPVCGHPAPAEKIALAAAAALRHRQRVLPYDI